MYPQELLKPDGEQKSAQQQQDEYVSHKRKLAKTTIERILRRYKRKQKQ
jgi:hypothetical protein